MSDTNEICKKIDHKIVHYFSQNYNIGHITIMLKKELKRREFTGDDSEINRAIFLFLNSWYSCRTQDHFTLLEEDLFFSCLDTVFKNLRHEILRIVHLSDIDMFGDSESRNIVIDNISNVIKVRYLLYMQNFQQNLFLPKSE